MLWRSQRLCWSDLRSVTSANDRKGHDTTGNSWKNIKSVCTVCRSFMVFVCFGWFSKMGRSGGLKLKFDLSEKLYKNDWLYVILYLILFRYSITTITPDCSGSWHTRKPATSQRPGGRLTFLTSLVDTKQLPALQAALHWKHRKTWWLFKKKETSEVVQHNAAYTYNDDFQVGRRLVHSIRLFSNNKRFIMSLN